MRVNFRVKSSAISHMDATTKKRTKNVTSNNSFVALV